MSYLDFARNFWDEKADLPLIELLPQWISDPRFTPRDCAWAFSSRFMRMLKPPHRILEVGCGIGRVIVPMANLNPEAELVGVDISPKMIEVARSQPHPANVTYEVCDGCTVPPGPFDAAYSLAVFQHVPDEVVQIYLQSVSCALRPGGLFAFQYVDEKHAEPGPMSFPHETRLVLDWVEAAGLRIRELETNELCDQWTWIVAESR